MTEILSNLSLSHIDAGCRETTQIFLNFQYFSILNLFHCSCIGYVFSSALDACPLQSRNNRESSIMKDLSVMFHACILMLKKKNRPMLQDAETAAESHYCKGWWMKWSSDSIAIKSCPAVVFNKRLVLAKLCSCFPYHTPSRIFSYMPHALVIKIRHLMRCNNKHSLGDLQCCESWWKSFTSELHDRYEVKLDTWDLYRYKKYQHFKINIFTSSMG